MSYSCFVIAPIGEQDSQIRRDSDDLLDLVIRPALEKLDFKVERGDHRNEEGRIDVDVVQMVQQADLCVVDLRADDQTIYNANVYYELGRRDETGKPIILLKSKHCEALPVDIQNRRYIEYDLDSRQLLRSAQRQLEDAASSYLQRGFESSSGATLSELAQILQRVERKLDRLQKSGGIASTTSAVQPTATPTGGDGNINWRDRFRVAQMQRNIPLAEQALDFLRYQMDELTFYDFYVETAAAMGSEKAGQMLIAYADTFMDADVSFKKKEEYLACLVSYLGKHDKEEEGRELVEHMAEMLLRDDSADNEELALVYNQLSRLYHGIYYNTDDLTFVRMAIDCLQKALQLSEDNSLYFNLANCKEAIARSLGTPQEAPEAWEEARVCSMKALSMDDGKPDVDHLAFACRLCRDMEHPDYADLLERLTAIDPDKAYLIRQGR